MKVISIIIILMFLGGCSTYPPSNNKSSETLVVTGKMTVDDNSNLVEYNTSQAVAGIRTISLHDIGDKYTVKKGEIFEADFKINEAYQTIETRIDQSTGDITFSVIAKESVHKVEMNNLCDLVTIPSKDVRIEIVDNYNLDKRNKPYKIIVVPTFDYKCNVDGYMVRFDTEGRSNKCSDNKIVKLTETELDNCQKGNSTSPKKGPCGKKTNCPEWRMFRKCCP
jgi:hypothetical protein